MHTVLCEDVVVAHSYLDDGGRMEPVQHLSYEVIYSKFASMTGQNEMMAKLSQARA